MATMDLVQLKEQSSRGPRLERSLTLNFMGDWGMANFHRICGNLEVRHGGIEAVTSVFHGRIQVALATPAQLMSTALTGSGIFAPFGAMPSLRALAVLPQNDRMVFAIDPKYGIVSFEQLRAKKPALRIATSHNDGTNFIGHVASGFLKAHGLDEKELAAWGAKMVTAHRPEQAIAMVLSGEADALLQEAIMTPWWDKVIDEKLFVPLPAEPAAMVRFYEDTYNLGETRTDIDPSPIPAGFWKSLHQPLVSLDFSDFVVLVRDDLPEDVAYVLTWCLVETRDSIEAQYRHIRPEKSPLSYPLDPAKMAQAPIPLHPGARRYYVQAGHL